MVLSDASKADQTATAGKSQLIIRFYDPDVRAKDALGRQLDEILAWSDKGSPYNSEAPVVNLEVMQAFRSRSELRQNLRRSFERMLSFYGFMVSNKSEAESKQSESSEPASFPPGAHTNISASKPLPYHIVRTPDYRKKFANWAIRFDHNHLRITRILRCLRVLGLQTECTAFFDALERTYEDPHVSISDRSMGYWRLAVTRPLYLAPDDSKCKWLVGWEKEQEDLRQVDEEKARNERDKPQKQESVASSDNVEG
ncbi:uncharacterized protein J4E88_005690 [Alternaria novae-zelandiae]|uniref:uncharacterized protein n=1 Tax=Alternaria novae-zelandiae TaxID=430562 RepID=UPI0020C434BB|nr:uncharacterized protein J4E88_005690 [Alternaria novae-zelandiae]KAI4681183.1 hypothetical protein J4E88_005690 [Alternaria novae-zelandiae]